MRSFEIAVTITFRAMVDDDANYQRDLMPNVAGNLPGESVARYLSESGYRVPGMPVPTTVRQEATVYRFGGMEYPLRVPLKNWYCPSCNNGPFEKAEDHIWPNDNG